MCWGGGLLRCEVAGVLPLCLGWVAFFSLFQLEGGTLYMVSECACVLRFAGWLRHGRLYIHVIEFLDCRAVQVVVNYVCMSTFLLMIQVCFVLTGLTLPW